MGTNKQINKSPARDLYRWLAESWHYTSAIRDLNKTMGSRIPQRLNMLETELERLRHELSVVGVGIDPELEDRYLSLLQERRHLHQIWDSSRRLPDPHPVKEHGLAKALNYGELLLAVYGSGRQLSKAAAQDIGVWAARLGQYRDPDAARLARQLRKLVAEENGHF